MDRETLQKIMVQISRRDLFNDVGRLDVNELKKELEVTPEEIADALKTFPYKYRTHENWILVTFVERPTTIPLQVGDRLIPEDKTIEEEK